MNREDVYSVTPPNGRRVLARPTKYGIAPYHFASRTQADARCAMLTNLGFKAHVTVTHPKYIVMDEVKA